MTSMVERVARILDPEVWKDDIPCPTRDSVVSFHQRRQLSTYQAREAVEAMREHMRKPKIEVLHMIMSLYPSMEEAKFIWNSMIDAALKEAE